jgi:uncharacterized membrane protein
MHTEPIMLASVWSAFQTAVQVTKLHPILVNFTAALVPVSVLSDFVGRFRNDETLRHTAWWTLVCAVAVTPFTALAGWLFWMPDDNGVLGMTVHRWLGTSLAVLLFGLFAWRFQLQRQQRWATAPYLVAGVLFIGALIVQGTLGGNKVFGGP